MQRMNTLPSASSDPNANTISVREREFWDEHVDDLDHCLSRYAAGPDRHIQAMLDALEPLQDKHILDFACGAGVTAAFLAQRGASVTGIDVSPASIDQARKLAERLGLSIELIAGELTANTFAPESFDAVAGRYALHHIDLSVIAPIFKKILVPGGKGAFIETMGLNPLLNFARRRIAGRAAVASYGSEDERPLTRQDLRVIKENIGPVKLVLGEMHFLRIMDRNVLRYRWPGVSRVLSAADDLFIGLDRLSYHQVVEFSKTSV